MRLVEDFLARAGQGRCQEFRDVGEVLARVSSTHRPTKIMLTQSPRCQVAFKAFLNITPTIAHAPIAPGQPKEFALIFDENPLAEFVELPEEALGGGPSGGEGLWYSNVLCGVIRGALEMVSSPFW